MKLFNALAGTISIGVVIGALKAFVIYANGSEQAYVHALSGLHPYLNVTGVALQKPAFGESDLLPIYGASEELEEFSEFQSEQFFKRYPTGFAPFEAAHSADSFIIYAEAMAAIGPEL